MNPLILFVIIFDLTFFATCKFKDDYPAFVAVKSL